MEFLELNASKLEIAGKAQEKDVLHAISASGIATLCYAYKLRIKSTEKLVEKVQRKIKEKPNYTVDKITDVIGLRLITLFKNEVSKVLDEILKLLQHRGSLNPNPFVQNALDEVIIYTNGTPHDQLLTELRTILTEKNIEFKVVESKEGYSSVHVVTRTTWNTSLKTIDGAQCNIALPVEIQIRSVFEDAWGEIDHKFGYAMRSGKSNENLLYNLPLIQPHLKVLKQFTDACAQYADTIYASAQTPVSVKDSSGKISSMPSDDQVLQRFTELGVTEKFALQYVQGRHLRESALNNFAKNRVLGQEKCLQAASFFLTLYEHALAALPQTPGTALYLFYAQMNEALCLLSTESPQHVQTARQLYLRLRENYPGYTLVQFRLAQSEARLGNIDESLKLFAATQLEIEKLRKESKEEAVWTDQLPKTDFLHIESLLPKLMGYQYWRKGNIESNLEKQLENYLLAHDTTFSTAAEPIEQTNIANNLLYYAVEYLSRFSGPPDKTTKRLARSLHENLGMIEKNINSGIVIADLSTLDTMMNAYNFIGRLDFAQKMAFNILELAKDTPPGDAESTLTIIKKALQVKSMQGASTPANRA